MLVIPLFEKWMVNNACGSLVTSGRVIPLFEKWMVNNVCGSLVTSGRVIPLFEKWMVNNACEEFSGCHECQIPSRSGGILI